MISKEKINFINRKPFQHLVTGNNHYAALSTAVTSIYKHSLVLTEGWVTGVSFFSLLGGHPATVERGRPGQYVTSQTSPQFFKHEKKEQDNKGKLLKQPLCCIILKKGVMRGGSRRLQRYCWRSLFAAGLGHCLDRFSTSAGEFAVAVQRTK